MLTFVIIFVVLIVIDLFLPRSSSTSKYDNYDIEPRRPSTTTQKSTKDTTSTTKTPPTQGKRPRAPAPPTTGTTSKPHHSSTKDASQAGSAARTPPARTKLSETPKAKAQQEPALEQRVAQYAAIMAKYRQQRQTKYETKAQPKIVESVRAKIPEVAKTAPKLPKASSQAQLKWPPKKDDTARAEARTKAQGAQPAITKLPEVPKAETKAQDPRTARAARQQPTQSAAPTESTSPRANEQYDEYYEIYEQSFDNLAEVFNEFRDDERRDDEPRSEISAIPEPIIALDEEQQAHYRALAQNVITELNSYRLRPSFLKPNWPDYLAVLDQHNITKLYHFTAGENIVPIKNAGGLLSWHASSQRSDITVPVYGGDQVSRKLDCRYGNHDYVHLSFCDDHPMAYKLTLAGKQVVVLEINPIVAVLADTLFSDRNAADASHHQGGQLADLMRVNFEATQQHYVSRSDQSFKPHQAEVMVKTFVPACYIYNLEREYQQAATAAPNPSAYEPYAVPGFHAWPQSYAESTQAYRS